MTDRGWADSNDLFEPVLEFPDEDAQRWYASLVGLDIVKERLVKEAIIRLAPDRLADWSRRHHGQVVPAAAALLDRPPVFILAGEIGRAHV